MSCSQRRISILASCAAIVLVFVLSFPAGCGNDDFARPIQQFQSASAVVIGAARQSLQQMNDVEEKSELNRQIFEGEAFDESKIKSKDVISADELNARVNALDQLTRYTSALADLAALKAPAAVAQKFQDVGSGFKALSKDAEKLLGASGSFFDNPKFSGAVQVAAAGIGAVVRAVEERRSRREIEKEIRDHDADVNLLIKLVGDELGLAYQRRKQAESGEGVFLTNSLKLELAKPRGGDPVLRLLVGDRLRAWRNRQPALANADPKPSVDAMQKAHQALVAYLTAGKSPKNLSELLAAAQSFADRVQPLGQAIAALVGNF
ncbi:MAG TPA: hypothetical protein VKP58_01295 [Candidatus Acidoferrum sp.]|nr:hypothetical protein [Candidatus Acidoferrum sp.]